MIAFLLSPLGRKIAIYSAIAVGAFFAYRWWSNRLVEQGRSEGRLEQLKDDEKRLKEQQAEAQAVIDNERAMLAESVAAAGALKSELRKTRSDMSANLDKALAEIRAGREGQEDVIDRIPGDELDDAIRVQLRRLATPAAAADRTGTP